MNKDGDLQIVLFRNYSLLTTSNNTDSVTEPDAAEAPTDWKLATFTDDFHTKLTMTVNTPILSTSNEAHVFAKALSAGS